MDILLETERLILRHLTDTDAEAVHAIKLETVEPNHLLTLDDIRHRWLPNILV
ncbi:MAG: hypothetical protein N4J56_003254 [Chroococcidiopsis sp. SAG 2025]|uniref:hypothetical protein n=1 Tax=Chroococcidiopsis sp. SAG 2025 TaxID=171389 RepID=UPI00293731A1|nr:hypothetical protein [Chroococcidiopsis sp. SAG 2025]MDV2993600.1 hypothetical protein [Chroococcidiopsis sp. SAG 2025]